MHERNYCAENMEDVWKRGDHNALDTRLMFSQHGAKHLSAAIAFPSNRHTVEFH